MGEAVDILQPQPQFTPLSGGGLVVHAPAKINLNLLVAPLGADGFHQLDSLAAKVTLYDRIELLPGGGEIELDCAGADCGAPEKNLAVRAARLLWPRRPREAGGVKIRLQKSIPPGKGLGGGSSDAAAVLSGLDRMWDLRLAAGELAGLALQLGSDVPLFLGPPASRMTGRGQHLAPIRVHQFVAVLLLPAAVCPTPAVYKAFDELPHRPQAQLDPQTLEGPVAAWRGRLVNQLAAAACRVSPELDAVWKAMASALAVPVCLTGSGSAIFVLCGDASEAAGVLGKLPPDIRRMCVVVRGNPW